MSQFKVDRIDVGQGYLVDGGAGGGEGAGGVGRNPVHLLRHPEVESSLDTCFTLGQIVLLYLA